MKKAGIYVRVSTEHQVQDGYSISAQKTNLTKFAQDNNFSIFSIYADEGISGKNIKDRPAVKRMLEDMCQSKLDVVILYKFDRLTRNMSDTEDIIELIQKCGVQVFTLSGGVVDVSNANGRFMIRLNGAVAQLEREQTVERIKVAFEQKVRQGYSLACGTLPYGYYRIKGKKIIVVNEEEANVVRKIFKMYLNDKSLTEIAYVLNRDKIPTKLYGKYRRVRNSISKEKKIVNSVWQSKTIRLVLSNPIYIGKVRYGIKTDRYFETNGQHKPIIDKNTWNKAQNKLLKIAKTIRTSHAKEDRYYLGTLKCGICGNILTTNRTGGRLKKDGTRSIFHGYRCLNREKGLCTALGMSHSKVEEAFLKYVDNIENLTEIDNVEIDNKDEDLLEIESLKKNLNGTRKKKEEIMDLFMMDRITYEQLSYMTKELDIKIKEFIEQLELLEKKYKPQRYVTKTGIALSIKEHWKYLSNKERMDFLSNFIKEIVIVNNDKDRYKGKPEIMDVVFYE